MAFKIEYHVPTDMMIDIKKFEIDNQNQKYFSFYTKRDFPIQNKIFDVHFTKNVNFKLLKSKTETNFVPSGCKRYDVHRNGQRVCFSSTLEKIIFSN